MEFQIDRCFAVSWEAMNARLTVPSFEGNMSFLGRFHRNYIEAAPVRASERWNLLLCVLPASLTSRKVLIARCVSRFENDRRDTPCNCSDFVRMSRQSSLYIAIVLREDVPLKRFIYLSIFERISFLFFFFELITGIKMFGIRRSARERWSFLVFSS